jgi:hypothetical protein
VLAYGADVPAAERRDVFVSSTADLSQVNGVVAHAS